MILKIYPPEDFSFYETVNAHGWKQLLPFEWDTNDVILRRVHQFSDGTVRHLEVFEQDAYVAVRCDAEVDSTELINTVRRMLQMDRDLTPFHRLCEMHEELREVPGSRKGRMLRSPTLLEDIAKVILTTNTTWTQTIAMNARLISAYGAQLPGTDRLAYPTPERVASAPYAEFAEKVRMGYRAQAVHELFNSVANGSLDLDELETPALDSETVRRRLLSLRGVGPYAASCLMLYLGRPTQVSVDSWARTLLSRELGRNVTDKDVHDHFARYGEWRGLVYSFYPWKHEDAPNVSMQID